MSRSEDYLDNLLTSVTDKLNEFDDDFEQNRESLKESYQTQNDLLQKRRAHWMKFGKRIFCGNLRMKSIKVIQTMIFYRNSKES